MTTLANATTTSDNSVFAEVGIKDGHEEDRQARAPDGHPHAGLAQLGDDARRPQGGRDPARHGARVPDVRAQGQARLRLAQPRHAGQEQAGARARSASARSRRKDDEQAQGDRAAERRPARNKVKTHRVLDEGIANTVGTILQGVVKNGTAQARAARPRMPVAGKTGTTENYGDAWFVGWTPRVHGRGVGRLPEEVPADEDRVPGRAGGRRHVPGGHLEDVHGGRAEDRPAAGAQGQRRGRRACPGATPPPAPRPRPRPPPATPRPRRRRPDDGTDGGETAPAQPEEPDARAAGRHPARRAGADRARPRRRRDDAAVGRHGAAPRPARARAPRRAGPACPRPFGHGRQTEREPAAQNRHGSSAALVMPMRGPTSSSGDSQPGRGGSIAIGPPSRSEPLRSSSMSSAWVSLPGPEQRSSVRGTPAPLAHQLEPLERLQRADQHRGADALVLADGVEERVDAVGAVDVGARRRAEQDVRAGGEADVRVAGGLGLVVGLGLDDRARPSRRGAGRSRRGRGRRRRRRARRTRGSPVELGPRPLQLLAARAAARCRPRTPWTRATPAGRAARRTRRRARASGARAPRATGRTASGRPRASRARARPRSRATGGTARRGARAGRRRRWRRSARRRPRRRGARGRRRSPRSIPVAAASDSSSVSTASNRCSLSSCMSLL